MVKKILTKEEKEDKALADIVKFANKHSGALNAVIKLQDELTGYEESMGKIKVYKDKLDSCFLLLRREDEYLKQLASELGIRLKNRD